MLQAHFSAFERMSALHALVRASLSPDAATGVARPFRVLRAGAAGGGMAEVHDGPLTFAEQPGMVPEAHVFVEFLVPPRPQQPQQPQAYEGKVAGGGYANGGGGSGVGGGYAEEKQQLFNALLTQATGLAEGVKQQLERAVREEKGCAGGGGGGGRGGTQPQQQQRVGWRGDA